MTDLQIKDKLFNNKSMQQKALVKKANPDDDDKKLVEFEPKDDSDCDTEAITKEEEWVTKKKTELTTTRQIETRVKRQVVLEDGKVVEDSGPIVSTNTTEDTDKQETETTEKRDLGIPVDDAVAGNKSAALMPNIDDVDGEVVLLEGAGGSAGKGEGKLVRKMVTRPADGLVRETKDKRVISHEEIKDYLETEDVQHLGDFSDENYVRAVNSGTPNLQEVLLNADNQKQLVPRGPRIVANTTKSFKTIDSEDKEQRCLAQEDGKIITESKTTTEHEIIVDKELPEKDDRSTGSREKIETVEATQRFYKQRDEQNVDLLVDGKVVGTEMRYAAETMQVEKDGSLERPGDWDSLSDRIRKLRRPHQKGLLQPHKEATLLDRKDALTKRPLDYDREEETRKGETMKWLESHFGSESTASNDSRDDDGEVEPTKKTFFNVTIKSNQPQQNAPLTNGQKPITSVTYDRKALKDPEMAQHVASAGKSKYYQGISNWTERKEAPPVNHFASKAFREDLRDTVERNRLRKGEAYNARDQLQEGRYLVESNDNYVSREDILQQKQRQSLSSQFLAKSARNSRDRLNEMDTLAAGACRKNKEMGARHATNTRPELNYGAVNVPDTSTKSPSQEYELSQRRPSADFSVKAAMKYDLNDGRSKSYERVFDDIGHEYDLKTSNKSKTTLSTTMRPPSPEIEHLQTNTLGRPTVPQRRRAIEKKLRQQHSVSPPPPQRVALERQQRSQRNLIEPPPDYSPPPRSRSSSPHMEYVGGGGRNRNYRPAVVEATAYVPAQIIGHSSTLSRKQNQRTRFAPTTSQEQQEPYGRPMTVTQTTQTTPSTISTSTVTSHKSSMGQVIGNSLRKLVNKIRSASAERKLRMKSRSKSRDLSPTPQTSDKKGHTTYQQYNLIDSHISGQGGSNESEVENGQQEASMPPKIYSIERKSQPHFKRANSADPFAIDKDGDGVPSPIQRYYLGEDPYSSTLYGKENMYDVGYAKGNNIPREGRDNVNIGYLRQERLDRHERNNREANCRNRQDEGEFQKQRSNTTTTLGRYQRSGHHFAASTPNLNQDYRTAQTLPRKLAEHQQYRQPILEKTPHHQVNNGYNTLGHPDIRVSLQHQQQQQQPQHQVHNVGPAKPARTYAKALNRSKSFNVHAMNGSHDPSPIYIEKLPKNNYSNNLHVSQAYKSNPHLYTAAKQDNSLQGGLKSPSIVNLISRSQKDLSKLDLIENDREAYGQVFNNQKEDRKQIFLRGLHQQAPDLYKTLHGEESFNSLQTPAKYRQLKQSSSLETRTPIEINKDTASIVRHDSSSNDDYISTEYNNSHAKTIEGGMNRRMFYKDERRARRTPGATIISVRKDADK